MHKNAKLQLSDGSSFEGSSFGFDSSISGEVVFNTGMVGYPETFTDPSYRGQILVLTYPLIGNYGVPNNSKEDGLLKYFESNQIHIRGLIISDYSKNPNHWNSHKTLQEWLIENKIPAIYDVDTRALTQKLREHGSMLGKLIVNGDVEMDDPNKVNLVSEVSAKSIKIHKRGKKRVLLVDCGAKNNIIRSLMKRDVTVIQVPWNYDFSQEEFDGVMISNGPGDPKMLKEAITNVRKLLERDKPVFGICLGNQILALAAGGDTYKLKYGHRSQNQPCVEVGTKRCYITSQNHGFAVDTKSLPNDWEPWFVNANDGTNEGIRHKTKPFMSVQFHPEATPGPVDSEYMFDDFIKMLKK